MQHFRLTSWSSAALLRAAPVILRQRFLTALPVLRRRCAQASKSIQELGWFLSKGKSLPSWKDGGSAMRRITFKKSIQNDAAKFDSTPQKKLTFLSNGCRFEPERRGLQGPPPSSTGLWQRLDSNGDDICVQTYWRHEDAKWISQDTFQHIAFRCGVENAKIFHSISEFHLPQPAEWEVDPPEQKKTYHVWIQVIKFYGGKADSNLFGPQTPNIPLRCLSIKSVRCQIG